MKNKTLPPSQNESARLRELIREIGLPLRKLPDIISLNHEESLRWWSNVEVDLKLGYAPFSRVTELVGIDESKLFAGSYDRDLARRRLAGDMMALPERYLENQNSFIRTSAHIFRYMILTRGQHFADQVLYSMNVSPMIYQNLNTQKINLTYFADLLETLATKGFTQEELDTLASVIFLSLQDTELGQRFSAAENAHDVYTTLAKNFDYFDTNFDIKSEFVDKKYILKTTLPLDQHALLKGKPQNVQRLMRYRQILLAWFPYLAGMTPLFPKTELLRSTDVLEMKYEFNLDTTPKRPKKLLVV